MVFAGLKDQADRDNLIAFLSQAVAGGAVAATPAAAEAVDAGAPAFEPAPYPEGVVYADPPEPDAAEYERITAAVAALVEELPRLDYDRARFHPIHFQPRIAEASDAECLVCHQEILDHRPRDLSPAGVVAADSLAWYQTLDTYEGAQATFHYRHLQSDFAREVMQLDCVFCHQGNDPREESPDLMPLRPAFSSPVPPEFTLRKDVNPETTCLRCHGAMPEPEAIMGLSGPWHEIRDDFESDDMPNGCMSCHAELYRTVRHNVDYLKAASIEAAARDGTDDTCFGCHGGRAWYRISYPYPRHAWPDMDETVPDWAVDRPTQSEPQFALPAPAQQ